MRFDNSFASRLRQRLTINPPRIPTHLHDFIRQKREVATFKN